MCVCVFQIKIFDIKAVWVYWVMVCCGVAFVGITRWSVQTPPHTSSILEILSNSDPLFQIHFGKYIRCSSAPFTEPIGCFKPPEKKDHKSWIRSPFTWDLWDYSRQGGQATTIEQPYCYEKCASPSLAQSLHLYLITCKPIFQIYVSIFTAWPDGSFETTLFSAWFLCPKKAILQPVREPTDANPALYPPKNSEMP